MLFLNKFRTISLLSLVVCTLFTSCEKNGGITEPTYNVPASYNFGNVNYSGQQARIDMLSEMDAYIKTGNTGAQLDAQILKNMYANANNQFSTTTLNTSGKQLKDKTIEIARTQFEGFFDAVALASRSAGAPAAPGNAGLLTTADNKKYLVDANGVELAQVIQKGLMGAVFYNQMVDVYLSDDKIGAAVDNTTITPGEGTKMEHHWDEAFGYFGAPKDFPANKDNLKFWANYSNQLDATLGSNNKLMDAFLKGRAAISAKDMAGKNAAVSIIREEMERLVAASAIHELNAAKTNFADQAKKSHYLSEAIGFVMSLQFKKGRVLTTEQQAQVLAKIGTNLHNTTVADINEAINILSFAYKFDAIKGNL
jgi:hypothetical protein